MTDRPILFSVPMVQALLDGRKTQTRRILKGVPDWCDADRKPGYSCLTPAKHIEFRGHYPGDDEIEAGYGSKFVKLPFLKGDRLWVKETWRADKVLDDLKPSELNDNRIWYEADRDNCDRHGKTRVSIFMPRWASRLTLIVIDVRVERLQDCSEADAIAEGIHQWRHHPIEGEPFQAFKAFGREPLHRDPRLAYRDLWNSINGAGAWEANPWVVAVSFTVEQRNIDA